MKVTVYHGTNAPAFKQFDPSTRGTATDEGLLGSGYYFSTDPQVGRSSKTLLEAQVSLNKPLVLELPTWHTNKSTLANEALGTKGLSGSRLTSELQHQGHDGVILDYSPVGYHHKEIVVFHTSQIHIVGPVEKKASLSPDARTLVQQALAECRQRPMSGCSGEDDMEDVLADPAGVTPEYVASLLEQEEPLMASRVLARCASSQLGVAGVDSGTLLVIDPCYLDHWNSGEHPDLSDEGYRAAWKEGRHQLYFTNGVEAAVFVKGFDDGGHPVFRSDDKTTLTVELRQQDPPIMVAKVAARHAYASNFFNVGDPVRFGKYKNKRGIITRIFKDEKGHPAVEITPVPQGRKKPKIMGMYKFWHDEDPPDPEEAEEKAKTASTHLYHVTTPDVAEIIMREGSKIMPFRVGRDMGPGIYLSPDPKHVMYSLSQKGATVAIECQVSGKLLPIENDWPLSVYRALFGRENGNAQFDANRRLRNNKSPLQLWTEVLQPMIHKEGYGGCADESRNGNTCVFNPAHVRPIKVISQ